MPVYMNQARHTIDVPGGALVEAGGVVELDDAEAQPLVEDGLLLGPLDTGEAKKTTKKETSS